jgi:pentatricopeptide repeat protein
MWEQIAEGVGAAQTEIVIFVIAFLTHALFMGKLRIPRKSKLVANPKSAMAKVKSVEDPGPSGRKSPRSESNTMEARLKGCIQEGELKKSQKVLDEMRAAGLQPGRATFNDLLVVAVHCSIEDGCDVVEEMRSCGMKLDRVSCSILLKCIQRDTTSADIMRILSLLDEMDGETDEVLLNSFVDACIRVGRSDLLSAQLRKQRSSSKSCFKSLHTYGSLIRASGYAGDIAGVWETWRDMRKNRITPTSVTLGCMVEALTSNGETDASYELLHEMLSDPACKPMVNAVIYGTVLKGFSHAKKFDRVWSIYQEMLQHNLQFSIVTFNTVLDACARSGDMTRIPALLESMTKQGIRPNLITYGIIIKGYCQENRLAEALQVWESMESTTSFKPDEIMYNTILDGCARKGLYERGMILLDAMRASGIRPSNFTLSVLVKLASRANLLEKAFEICNEISETYNFRLNVHVFNNLIQACTTHNQLQRSFDVLERMVCERVRPDARTYTLLIKGSVGAREAQDAVGFVRAALGLQDCHPILAQAATLARLPKGLPSDFLVEALEGISHQCQDNKLAMTLLKELKQLPSLRLPSQLQLRLANQAMSK